MVLTVVEDVKLALRISTDAYDSEIEDIVEGAQLDMKQSGVSLVELDDPLIKRAIITYAKANFGLDQPNAERFQQSYDMLKQHLSLAGDYNGRPME